MKIRYLIDPDALQKDLNYNLDGEDETARKIVEEVVEEAPRISAVEYDNIYKGNDDIDAARFGLNIFTANYCHDREKSKENGVKTYRCTGCVFNKNKVCLVSRFHAVAKGAKFDEY